jgi:hypothetical protein
MFNDDVIKRKKEYTALKMLVIIDLIAIAAIFIWTIAIIK